MRRIIVLGLLLGVAACGRDRRAASRDGNEVALGDTTSVTIDSAAEDAAKTAVAPVSAAGATQPESTTRPAEKAAAEPAPKPAAEKPAPKPAAAPPPITAEEAAAASATVGKVGLTVYPAKGQSKDQTVRDELACTDWAKQQTGIDPMTVSVNTDSAAAAGKKAADSAASGARLKGAARGAAAGAVVGAIAGDAGTGAAIGAAGGAVAGGRKKRAAAAQGAEQGAAQAESQATGALTTFGKSMSACLEGKGYSVK